MEEEVVSTITGNTKVLLEGLLLVLSLLYNRKYTNDYRIVLIKSFNQQYDNEPVRCLILYLFRLVNCTYLFHSFFSIL